MTCGENIKKARKAVGLTQAQLAKKCGYATITIQQYERNLRQPSVMTLGYIAKALHTTVSELIEDKWSEYDLSDAWNDVQKEKPATDAGDGWKDAVRALPPDLLGLLSDFVQLAKEDPETARRYLAFAVQELQSRQ